MIAIKCLLIFSLVKYHVANQYIYQYKHKIPSAQNEAKFLEVLINTKLVNVEHFVQSGWERLRCLGQCMNLPKCHSINFKSDGKICEVNYNVVASKKKENLIPMQGWTYYEKEIEDENEGFLFGTKEHDLSVIRHIYTIPHWTKAWRVSFHIKLFGPLDDYSYIIRFGKYYGGSWNDLGKRQPLILLNQKSSKLRVSQLIQDGLQITFLGDQDLEINVYHFITVMQTPANDGSGNYIMTIKINGTQQAYEGINNYAVDFENIKVYTGVANAVMKNLYFTNFR